MLRFHEMKLEPWEHRSVCYLLASARRQGFTPLRPPGRWRAEFFIGPLGIGALRCPETEVQRAANDHGIVCNVVHVMADTDLRYEWVAVIEFRTKTDATAFKTMFL